jgi:ferritin-like metal-binding protein YciE
LVSWANLLEQTEAVELLEESLEEEKATDEKLTEIAEVTANVEEAEESEEDEVTASSKSTKKR